MAQHPCIGLSWPPYPNPPFGELRHLLSPQCNLIFFVLFVFVFFDLFFFWRLPKRPDDSVLQITPFGLHLGAFRGPRYETKGTPKWASLIYLPKGVGAWERYGFWFPNFWSSTNCTYCEYYYIYGLSVSYHELLIRSMVWMAFEGPNLATISVTGLPMGWNPWILCTNQGYHRFLLVFGCLKTLDHKKKETNRKSFRHLHSRVYLFLYHMITIGNKRVIQCQTWEEKNISSIYYVCLL